MGNEASTGGGGVFGEDGAGLQSPSARAIDSDVRRRLARGVQYNMKIVIRGDRNTGKTQLWRRLQGQHFTAAYTPTEQIQIATINWNYKVSSDVVKLDAWDVVDRAPKRKKAGPGVTDSGLKIANTQAYDASELNGDDDDDYEDEKNSEGAVDGARKNEFGIGSVVPLSPGAGATTPKSGSFSVGALDATVVDVMRGATGCIMMFDMTKKWTWEYITRELPKVVRKDIQVLVVGNFRDMGESGRVVSETTAKQFCALAGDNVHYLEASMKNGYGVRAIANFFSLPFLSLQKKYIDEQLRRNREETDAALNEIRALTEELTYDMYLKQLADRKAATVTATSTPPPAAMPVSPSTPPAKQQQQQQQQQQQLPTAVDTATQKRIEQEEKQRAKKEAQEAKARQEEEARRKKAEEKRQKEEQRQKEAYNRAHAKELEQQRLEQAAEDAAAAAELKRLAAEMKAKQQQGGGNGSTAGKSASSLQSVDDFKIAGADDDGWLTKAAGAGATDDDGWLVTPEGKETGQADPFAFGADDGNDDDGFGGTLGADGSDNDDDAPVTPVKGKGKGKKGKKGAHRQAFLADADEL